MIDYSSNPKMKWLTFELQEWFHLASISIDISNKKFAFGKIAELSVKKEKSCKING